MSENVVLTREAYEAYNREGITGILMYLDPEVEWRNPAHHRGRDACMRHLAEITEDAELHVVGLDYIDACELPAHTLADIRADPDCNSSGRSTPPLHEPSAQPMANQKPVCDSRSIRLTHTPSPGLIDITAGISDGDG